MKIEPLFRIRALKNVTLSTNSAGQQQSHVGWQRGRHFGQCTESRMMKSQIIGMKGLPPQAQTLLVLDCQGILTEPQKQCFVHTVQLVSDHRKTQ